MAATSRLTSSLKSEPWREIWEGPAQPVAHPEAEYPRCASGAIAGLVAITPASGFVAPIGALIIGIAAGILCFFASTSLKRALGYDDSLDVFGIHGIGGIVGALLTGIFAVEAIGGTAGVLEGNIAQILPQIYGVLATIVWSGVISFVLLKVIDVLIGLRVGEEIERDSLDLQLHGETVQ